MDFIFKHWWVTPLIIFFGIFVSPSALWNQTPTQIEHNAPEGVIMNVGADAKSSLNQHLSNASSNMTNRANQWSNNQANSGN